MKCEIDIDLGKLADEWEPVAFRQLATGDWFVTEVGPVMVEHAILDYAERSGDLRLIVRRRWKWPEWLTAEWIAMDKNGQWWTHDDEPVECSGDCFASRGRTNCLNGGDFAFITLPCTDWRQSKRRNPRAK